MRSSTLLFIVSLLVAIPTDDGFYVPGVAPVEFAEADPIEVKAIKLTSVKTQIPYEYYNPGNGFCTPDTGVKYYSENLGEVLRGDRIVNTAYKVQMKTEIPCRALCGNKTKSAPSQLTVDQTNTLIRRIKNEYHVHLIVDNLPCATRVKTPDMQKSLYDHGYRLGYVAGDGSVYVHNHLTLVLHYHEHEPGKYRVVGFEVEPRSVDTSSLKSWQQERTCSGEDLRAATPQKLEQGKESQIRWTYSVRWEPSTVKWASRWDIYLSMSDVQIHWFSIINSIVVVLCLSGFLSVIMIRTIRRDIAQYNKDEEMDETLEESGWKLVHGDVFRPPPHPKLLTSFVGSGIQLFGMALVTIFFAMLGMLSPASRGSIMTAALFLYCFMGLIAGYYSGRLYKTLRGVQWKRTAFQTCCLFPGLVLGTGFVLNFFLIGKQSSGAVPFPTMLLLLFMWFGIDLPLVFMGFYFGYRKQSYQHPVRTNQIPRQVPEQPWYLQLLPCVSLAGILPFGAMFIELFFIFSALWENQFYYLFGFLFLVTVILMISCGQIAIVVTYFQLCSESYHWWWRSFFVGGSCALYVYGYSIFYYVTKLEIVDFIPTLLYFAYTGLMAMAFFFLTATVGFYASYWFICKIYGAVKID